MHRQQTVAEHSHGVAVLVTIVEPNASAELLQAALFHDISEAVTGDVPSTAKWAYPEVRAALNAASMDIEQKACLRMTLTVHEQNVLRWCDMAELVLFALEEWYGGNYNARKVVENGMGWLREHEAPTIAAEELRAFMWQTQSNFHDGVFEYADQGE